MQRIIILFVVLIICLFPEASAQKPITKNYFAFSSAVFDILQKKSTSMETRLEVRLNPGWTVNPFGGIMTNTGGAVNLFAGFFKDIYLNSFLILTPSFAPGIYYKHNSKDLHFLLEFRSQIEIAVKFENNIKVGVGFSHTSNASLGNLNPGVESLAMIFYFPI